jgi:ABC-type Mn2+/Zn2+ transport system permease subunit
VPRITRSAHFIALALIVSVVGGLSFPLPDGVPSTYAAVLAVVVGAVSITMLTWRNAMATDTIAGLIHRTDREARRTRRW